MRRAAGFLLLFGAAVRCTPGSFYFEDAPELLACAAGLGNSHPPGYPLLALAGRLALLLPAGHPAFRFNSLIAGCGALAAVALGGLTAAAARRWLGAGAGTAAAAGVLAAGVWGLSDTAWWEAVIGDKYAPYYLAFMVLLGAAWRTGTAEAHAVGREGARSGLLLGLGFAHHQYAIFVLPAFAVAAGRAGLLRGLGARIAPARTALLAVGLSLLPFSTKVLYPPLRSAGGADPDWGRPRIAGRLGPYLTGALYRAPFASTSLPVHPGLSAGRLAFAGRMAWEEIPGPLLLAAMVGLGAALRHAPGAALTAAACAAANAAYALNFSEKVVRWWEPSLALAAAAAGLGVAWMSRPLGARGVLLAATLAVAACGWQADRGWSRNDLSRWYAAHDFGRHVLRALPAGAAYLGAGDFDLFPLWALRIAGQERPDVEAAGVAGFLDSRLAAGGAEERIAARAGIPGRGPEAVAALLAARRGPPVFVPPAGFDAALQNALPFLKVTEVRGLVARPVAAWQPAQGAAASRRQRRGMTLRGLRTVRSGALADLVRPRDEVARGALLQYAACFSTLGAQCAAFGLDADAAWAFRTARGAAEALTGPVAPPPVVRPGSAESRRAEADRRGVALAYQRLADVFAARGVTFLAEQFRGNAAAVLR